MSKYGLKSSLDVLIILVRLFVAYLKIVLLVVAVIIFAANVDDEEHLNDVDGEGKGA